MKVEFYGDAPPLTKYRMVKDYLKEQPEERRGKMIGARNAKHETLFRRGLSENGVNPEDRGKPRRVPAELVMPKKDLHSGEETGILDKGGGVGKKDETSGLEFAGAAGRAAYRARLGASKGTPEVVDGVGRAEANAKYVENKTLKGAAKYNSDEDAIEFNPDYSAFPQTVEGLTFLRTHEILHRADSIRYFSWDNEGFVSTINKASVDLDKVVAIVGGKKVTLFDKVLEETEKLTVEDQRAVHDILSALRKGKNDGLSFGHSAEYWESDATHVPAEIFANIGGLDVLGKKGFSVLRQYFFEMIKNYRKVVK